MGFFDTWFITPVSDILTAPVFFFEVVLGGLMAGVMYSMVALGFVLIFKASGVFNFSQGIMVLFAALTLVGQMERGVPLWAALPITIAVMVALAYGIERLVLRPLVNQEPLTLLMATIGLTFFLEGLGEFMWGSNVKRLDLGIPDNSFEFAGMLLNSFELFAALTAAVLVALLAVLSQKTAIGRALRAVADDHQAATAVGIPLQTIWVTVWSVAGLVALVAGIMWGSKSGVQFSLSLIALKALPVLILGGITSIPGAIVGGLIIGVGEEDRRGLLGPGVWRRHRELVRLRAGDGRAVLQAARAVRRRDHRKGVSMLYRETGQFKTSYRRDQAIFPIVQDRWCVAFVLVAAYGVVPALANEYWLQAVLIPFLVYALAAIGLNLLTGYTGQLSLGTGGFMAVGAYAAYKLTTAVPELNIVIVFPVRRPHGCHGRAGVRPAEPAHQGAVPGGGDAGGAVLPHLAVQPRCLVLQLQPVGHHHGAAADPVGHHGDRSRGDRGGPIPVGVELRGGSSL